MFMKQDKKVQDTSSPCPECGSTDTGSSTYTDYCNNCGWGFSYINQNQQNENHNN